VAMADSEEEVVDILALKLFFEAEMAELPDW
jgi:hypothetical protein